MFSYWTITMSAHQKRDTAALRSAVEASMVSAIPQAHVTCAGALPDTMQILGTATAPPPSIQPCLPRGCWAAICVPTDLNKLLTGGRHTGDLLLPEDVSGSNKTAHHCGERCRRCPLSS